MGKEEKDKKDKKEEKKDKKEEKKEKKDKKEDKEEKGKEKKDKKDKKEEKEDKKDKKEEKKEKKEEKEEKKDKKEKEKEEKKEKKEKEKEEKKEKKEEKKDKKEEKNDKKEDDKHDDKDEKEGQKMIGVMTCGGDCPGLNAVIRGVVFHAIRTHNWRVMGIEDSMCGLIDLDYRSPDGNQELTVAKVDNIIKEGGTILGCSNKSDPFRFAEIQPDGSKKEIDVSDRVIANYHKLGLSALVVIGGDGTMRIAHKLSLQSKGTMNVVGCPKTIDNDLVGTDMTFGFNSAVQTITDALDRIQDTARSHDRVIIVEVMGRDSGWLALHGGMAGRADVIVLPEIPYDVKSILKKVERRNYRGTPFSVIVIAEGAKPKDGEESYLGEQQAGEMKRYGGAGAQLAHLLKVNSQHGDLDVRVSVLGYIQRGGTPSAFDRVIGTRFGVHAVDLISEGRFNHLVVAKGIDISDVPFEQITSGQKFVDPDSEIVRTARRCGVCFGDEKHD